MVLTRKEIAVRIRQMTNPGERQPCFVCGKYRGIAHAHHIIPVHELAEFIENFSDNMDWFPTATVWLCPNHHAILHAYSGTGSTKQQMDLVGDVTAEELARLDEIAQMVDLLSYIVR